MAMVFTLMNKPFYLPREHASCKSELNHWINISDKDYLSNIETMTQITTTIKAITTTLTIIIDGWLASFGCC